MKKGTRYVMFDVQLFGVQAALAARERILRALRAEFEPEMEMEVEIVEHSGPCDECGNDEARLSHAESNG